MHQFQDLYTEGILTLYRVAHWTGWAKGVTKNKSPDSIINGAGQQPAWPKGLKKTFQSLAAPIPTTGSKRTVGIYDGPPHMSYRAIVISKPFSRLLELSANDIGKFLDLYFSLVLVERILIIDCN